MPDNNVIVGFSGITMLGYTFILIGIHIYIPHPSVTKKVISLSYTSLTLLALAQACIVGTYFIPHISGACICSGLWSAALIFYVVGLYTLKFVYVERIAILNKHPMLASEKIAKWIKYITCSLVASCVICCTMMIALTDGECHEDRTRYGCKPSFHEADVYLAIIMIIFDAALFGGFCYKWWGLIKCFKVANDSQVLIEMIQSFSIQFILTCLAMLSCVIDGIINLWYRDYSTLIIFCVDCAVIASCDFAMIKESQAFMWKYVCWPCRMPSFLLKGTSLQRVESKTTTTNTGKSETSKTGNSKTTTTTTTNTVTSTEPAMTPQPNDCDNMPSGSPMPQILPSNSTQPSNSPPNTIKMEDGTDVILNVDTPTQQS